jgi:hypothetical protein
MSGLGGYGKAVPLMLASAAVRVLLALSYPRTVHHPLLGSDWRCSRTALLTSCTYEGARANIGDEAADDYRQRRRSSAFTGHLEYFSYCQDILSVTRIEAGTTSRSASREDHRDG